MMDGGNSAVLLNAIKNYFLTVCLSFGYNTINIEISMGLNFDHLLQAPKILISN